MQTFLILCNLVKFDKSAGKSNPLVQVFVVCSWFPRLMEYDGHINFFLGGLHRFFHSLHFIIEIHA